jgi:hypothetical protein
LIDSNWELIHASFKKYICPVFFLALYILNSAELSFSAACTVGDLTQGYWLVVGQRGNAGCVLPGAPDPESAFLQPNGGGQAAFRIEGGYMLDAGLTGKGWFSEAPECNNACIEGFADWACNGYKRYNSQYTTFSGNGQLCIYTYDDGQTIIHNYACFEEILTLSEWVCSSCVSQYNQLKQKCGISTIINWDNATCTGTCVDYAKNTGNCAE